MADYSRKDIHQTSTGVGHHYRPGYYFPSSNFRTVLEDPLPPPLVRQDEITKDEIYKTTTGAAHDLKHLGGPYGNRDPLYKKSPGHWKIGYVKDHHEKISPGGWRRPLTMGNQMSETKAKFCNEPGLNMEGEFSPAAGPQGFLLKDHHHEGPTKKLVPSTQNDKLRGKPFFVRDQGVLNLMDPYLTTTNQYHRSFKPKELQGYPKKNIATYWECEEYPKAWGHGQKHNPLPKDTVPRERLPMRDPTWFKTATRIPRPPNSLVHVPHSGLKSLQKESYQRPSDVKMKETFYCPVNTPYTLPDPGPKSVMTAPGMYKTESKTIGSREPVSV